MIITAYGVQPSKYFNPIIVLFSSEAIGGASIVFEEFQSYYSLIFINQMMRINSGYCMYFNPIIVLFSSRGGYFS